MKQQAWNPGALLVVILLGAVSFTLSDPFISIVSKGESATLYCNASLQAGSQAQWTRRGVSGDKCVIVTRQEDGRVVKEIKDLQNRFQIDDRFSIHFERVDPGDLGTYECGGRETSLIVLADPASHTVSEGESVTLHCGDSADLAGAGSVRWKQVNGGTGHSILYKDPAGKTVTQVNDPDHRYELRLNSSLYIRKVKSADSGRYECNGIHVADLKVLTATSTTTTAKTTKLTESTPSSESTTTTSKATAVSTTESNKISSTAPSKQTTVLTTPPKKETATNVALFTAVGIIIPILAAAIFIFFWKRRSMTKESQDNTGHVYETVKEPTTAKNNFQDCKEHAYYSVIQEPNALQNNPQTSKESQYALVQLSNVDKNNYQDCKEHVYYSVIQEPNTLQNNPHTSKESQYALVQLSKVEENSDQDKKETEYSLLHAPKATDCKSQNSKEPEYELVKAPKEKLESQDIK
ncbi:uncharacterized protein LOC131707095 [Acipenser ruthenus]|uniref:uncharacterized protein LOC131707095 n=1 Tax=Acipenser ruthenus TaxID=7906 RepID=UPI0027410664|nr:uncharacterized protein LOC131707095 [Acipenser ruthenus]